jgi:proteic killer suppression protein
MIVTFEEEYLMELYKKGRTSNKKYRFQPDIIKRYIRQIDTLISAPSQESLYKINSLHFKALQGNKKGLFSVRVNDQYRIEFTMDETLDKPSVTICNIVELTNHYE